MGPQRRYSNAKPPGSDAEALATLGTAGVEHFLTVFCGHAGTESVGAQALDVTRLKGSLHDVTAVDALRTALS